MEKTVNLSQLFSTQQMKILGKPIADQILRQCYNHHKTTSKLVIIQVGSHKPSTVYIKKKLEAFHQCGLICEHKLVKETITQKDLLAIIEALNQDPSVGGILLQLPVPNHLDSQRLIHSIHPSKDVDCLTPKNLGDFYTSPLEKLSPPTAQAIIAILDHLELNTTSKTVTLLGKGRLVGKPVSLMLCEKKHTVTVCNHLTPRKQIQRSLEQSDIVISATGQHQIVPVNWLPQNATVIDVGLSKQANGKLSGDILTDDALAHGVKHITPWIGGIGPVTVACLIRNFTTLLSINSPHD